MRQIRYERKYHKQKEVTFAIDMTTFKIEVFYDYFSGKKIRYRVGKKLLNKAMMKISNEQHK